MELLAALILGVIQGATEFLPISSTGHLILVREALSMETINALAFDAVLHLSTACAVLVYFWRDIMGLVHTSLRILGRLPVGEKDQVLLYALALGTIPAAFMGLLLEDIMGTLFRNPLLVATVLIVGSMLFAYAEYVHAYRPQPQTMSTKLGFKIGLFQILALVPGMSRSGATIAGGLILGLSRYESARFAFLLAIPLMLGAGLKKFIELLSLPGAAPLMTLAVGALSAFVVALVAIHFMLGFVRNNSLWPFIWYRIVLAVFVVLLVFFG